jgi:competence protein ComGC
MDDNPWKMSLKEMLVIFAIISVWLTIFFSSI